ncbi:unnamed protein product [Cylicocyclus nassatus]|uniref:Uncharacterized protein n=1 Tax=Cylicocyclus nassatus TaxID=53992 RepID=A0AA36H745_CYLNA|nr:unnamed protein product [Cylicocyclus nassatus]
MAIIHHLPSLLLFIVCLIDFVDAGSSCGEKNKTVGYTAQITTTTTTTQPPNYAYNRQLDIKPPTPSTTTTTTTTTTKTTTPPYINPYGGCHKYTDEEKRQILSDLGTYNPIFMAMTPEEAALNFAPVFKKLRYGDKPYPDYEDVLIKNGRTERVCRSTVCRTLLEKLQAPIAHEEWLSDDQQALSESRRSRRDEHEHHPHDHVISGKGKCRLTMRNEECKAAGELVGGGLRLCTQCQRVYVVSSNCSPRFINTARCQSHGTTCIHNAKAGKSYGFSREDTLPMTLLRSVGDPKCEKFLNEDFEVSNS